MSAAAPRTSRVLSPDLDPDRFSIPPVCLPPLLRTRRPSRTSCWSAACRAWSSSGAPASLAHRLLVTFSTCRDADWAAPHGRLVTTTQARALAAVQPVQGKPDHPAPQAVAGLAQVSAGPAGPAPERRLGGRWGILQAGTSECPASRLRWDLGAAWRRRVAGRPRIPRILWRTGCGSLRRAAGASLAASMLLAGGPAERRRQNGQ